MIRLPELMLGQQRCQPIARHRGRIYNAEHFRSAVAFWANGLADESNGQYALYCDDAYPFAVLLFALLHAGKQVWIAGNNRPGSAEQLQHLGCALIGDWQAGFNYRLDAEGSNNLDWQVLDSRQNNLVIFTSGSTGVPQPIFKSLAQFQAEIESLERQWGQQLADSQVLATVSHQHIYGLLFRVLWPLAAERCFESEAAINPETVLKHVGKACWIASPAHLKRLERDIAWDRMAALSTIFSSGGALPAQTAEQIARHGGQTVIEVYGSSETGGIAWRQYPDSAWTLFGGLHLTDTEDVTLLRSPYLISDAPYPLEDVIDLQPDGRFLLHGRRDRIVKIEEKRLSLTEQEQRLLASNLLADAVVLVLERPRHTIAVAAVLSADGEGLLRLSGRKALIRRLRDALTPWFEPVLLPRCWLFLNGLPQTSQGKLDTPLLTQLLSSDGRLPKLQALIVTENSADLLLKIPDDLRYFPDHFPGYPLLPGVVQIGWAEHFAKLLFRFQAVFSTMEAIKFVKPIRPGYELRLRLNWHADNRKLNFNYSDDSGSFSSGRLIYDGAQS